MTKILFENNKFKSLYIVDESEYYDIINIIRTYSEDIYVSITNRIPGIAYITKLDEFVNKELFELKHFNILHSLDILYKNDRQNLTNINILLNKKIKQEHINFSNYYFKNLKDAYINIIDELQQPLNSHNIFYRIGTLISEQNFNGYNLQDYFTAAIMQQLKNINNVIDAYLEIKHNVPYSNNEIYNYLFFLRRFKLFKELMIENLKNDNDTRAYDRIRENDILEQGIENTFYNTFLKFEDEDIIIYNTLKILSSQGGNIFNLIYEFKFVEITLENLNLTNEIRGLTDNVLILNNLGEYLFKDARLYAEKIEFYVVPRAEKELVLLCIVLKYYFKLFNYDINKINTDENLRIITSKLLFRLYSIFEFLNLNYYPTINNVFREFDVQDLLDPNSNRDTNNNYGILVFYIISAYYLFKRNLDGESTLNDKLKPLYENINFEIYKMNHFFYVVNYFKSKPNEILSLFIFFCFSNPKFKIINVYNKSNNNILNFFEQYYDIIYKNQNIKKYVLDIKNENQ